MHSDSEDCTESMFLNIIVTNLLLFLVSINSDEEIQISTCICVPYYQCEYDTGYMVTDGSGLFDIRGVKLNNCSGYFDVCCNESNEKVTAESPIQLTGCGYQSARTLPWSGAFLYKENKDSESIYKCGFSLIHPQVGVTAAHCITSSTKLWEIKIGHITRDVEQIIEHPKFNTGTLQYDVALLILKDPVDHPEKVSILCIPPPGMLLEPSKCLVNLSGKKNGYLRITKLPYVSREKCQTLLRETRLGPYFVLHNTFLCAGGEAYKDTCDGDGGSPLVCSIPSQPGRYHQIGIVSWGIGCGVNNTPGVYVNLGLMRDWIDECMTKNGFSVNTYRY